jgi:OOP family OmpA-OmpF porin
MTMTPLRTLAVALATLPAVAFAKEPATGFYVGGGLGQSSWSIDYAAQIQNAYQGTGFTVDQAHMTDDRDTAWKLYGGWRFHPYGAVELGYQDFGRATGYYEIGVPNIGPATRDARYRLDGVELSALGVMPFAERATLFVKAGALFARLRYDESGTNQFGEPASFSHNDRHTRFLWGLGGTYEIVDAVSVRLEWQRVQDVGDTFALTENGNGRFDHVDYAGIALQWRFR